MILAEFAPFVGSRNKLSIDVNQNPLPKGRIAVVSPDGAGGVKTTISKFVEGLRLEGFHVSVISLAQANLLAKLCSDVASLKGLHGFDAIVYMGSIPWPSHIFISDDTLIVLFVHGFVRQELVNAIKLGNLRTSLGAMFLLSLWSISKLIDKIDLFICRCYTSCEVNGIHRNYVLLPEFVLPHEIELYSKISKSFERDHSQGDKIKVLTYTSYAGSPRLLRKHHVISLVRDASRSVKKEIELTIIDPKRKCESVERVGNLTIRHVCLMSKELFLKELLSSDMYVELCIDEELRNVSLDAGLMGTPIAKLTYAKFIERQDYTEDCLIQAETYKGLVRKVADYLNDVEYYKPLYSKNMKEFILKQRTWDVVKKPLLNHLARY
jgi:hypothetical protein